ncbi:type II toxin-antitoxin system VapC family toxin [Coleofasciculus sp. H7-2]|uniref:type II toxin-antitoxin system VapC family toxin n=1 Tax=Coleofasciculus sp. H7-2 TaxID=3351545 RepID=UPI00367083D3
MKMVFADTFYWISLINPRDGWHKQVLEVTKSLTRTPIVTTDQVLVEVLAFYSKSGTRMRQRIVQLVRNIMNNSNVQIVEQTHESFLSGLDLYESRIDKGYSLTDGISMITMRELGIAEVLTHDKHFTQEGFTILFRNLDD